MKFKEKVKILAERIKIPEEAVYELIQMKKEELKGLLSDHGAFVMVANEHGINIEDIDLQEYDERKKIATKTIIDQDRETIMEENSPEEPIESHPALNFRLVGKLKERFQYVADRLKDALSEKDLREMMKERMEKGADTPIMALIQIAKEYNIPTKDLMNAPQEKKTVGDNNMEKGNLDQKPSKASSLTEIEKKMALTVRDEGEGITIPNESALTVTHYPSEEEILFLINRRKFVKEKLIDNTDKMKIAGNIFLKKSAWRKYINAFGISIEILSEKVEERTNDVIAIYTVKATAPTGQFVEATGTKSKSEYWSEKYQNYGSYTLHNLKATARTRAINIAVSDLVGYGETSAEELSEQELIDAE